MKTHNITSLPKWAQEHIRSLETRVERAEQTIPWTKPGMEWFTVFHPDHRAPDGPESVKLFVLYENGCHPVCSVGRNDCLFVGRGRSNQD